MHNAVKPTFSRVKVNFWIFFRKGRELRLNLDILNRHLNLTMDMEKDFTSKLVFKF